jgi:3-deoxy-D-manno-octulosonic-acid transferase
VALTLEEQNALRRSLRLYRTAAPFVAMVLVPSFLRRLIKRGGYKAHFFQRFGIFQPDERRILNNQRWTWIRSISVGETLVALKLAHALKDRDPAIKIAVSVTTSTGYAVAAKEMSDWLFVFYNPVDSLVAVRRVLDILKPTGLILIDGEIWPNLMSACLEKHLPVMLANARLSEKSAAGFAKFKHWTSPFFKLLQWVGIPDSEDQSRWESIGVSAQRIVLTGSIKFDQTRVSTERQITFADLLRESGVSPEHPLLVAGSTHDGEEEILAQALTIWRKETPNLRLLIAPRHVERVPNLVNVLKGSGAKVFLRSSLPSKSAWDILLLDTTGELRDWYALATIAFIGKSLTALGGQNPVEPALAGIPVIFGPHMENFESVTKLLLSKNAALQAVSKEHLVALVTQLLSDPEKRTCMGKNGLSALSIHQGATERTAQLVLETINPRLN